VIRSEGDEVAVTLLRAVEDDQVRSQDVESSVRMCLAMAGGGVDRCLNATTRVLEALAGMSRAQEHLIVDALRQCQASASSNEAVGRIANLVERVQSGTASAQNSARHATRDYWAELAGSDLRPTRADIGRVRQDVLDARLHVFARGLLDPAPAKRLQEAFQVADAEGCDGLLEGKAEGICVELGLWRVQRACLSVAFEELHGFTGAQSLVTRFRGLDRGLVERVAVRVQGSDDDGLIACLSLVQRWMGKQPTRWQAWADTIELLGSGY